MGKVSMCGARAEPGATLAAFSRVKHAAEMKLDRLPAWVVDNATSVRREAEPYRALTPAARWEITRRCCRAALSMLRRSPHADRALTLVDPLPQSTIDALARLRASR